MTAPLIPEKKMQFSDNKTFVIYFHWGEGGGGGVRAAICKIVD